MLTTRHARAVAFVKKGLGKKKAWSDLTYAYDFESEAGMLFLQWYDDNPKHSIEIKITDAIAAYQERYGVLPNVALVSEADQAPASVAGVRTQIEKRVSRNNIQVGYEG